MARDLGAELDGLQERIKEMEGMLRHLLDSGSLQATQADLPAQLKATQPAAKQIYTPSSDPASLTFGGAIYYSGHMANDAWSVRWEPQDRDLAKLVDVNSDKAAKVLAALGHKQRLDILIAVMQEPLTGLELVEKLGMGTTGQLYHHLKALTGAGLLAQEERGGRYSLTDGRALPIALLLAAVVDVLDTSDYLEMTQARNQASNYLGGAAEEGYDPHHLLWAVMDNAVREHQAGYCTELMVFLHGDGSVTVSDNGRGIPVAVLPQTEKPTVQTVLTDIRRMQGNGESYRAPGAENEISISVVNALSHALTVEIRRDGKIYRQQYRQGIPLTGVLTVGATGETGTSVTLMPSPELFRPGFDRSQLARRQAELAVHYPNLKIGIEDAKEE